MLRRLRIAISFASSLLLATASSAGAQDIIARSSGLVSPLATYSFLGVASNGDAVTNQVTGLTISGAYFGSGLPSNGFIFGDGAMYNFNPLGFGQMAEPLVSVKFAATNAVAFNFGATLGKATITVLKNGSTVRSFTADVPDFIAFPAQLTKWWGFQFNDGTTFDELAISAKNDITEPQAFGFDNLQLGTATVVPEPATVGLMLMGLAGLGIAARRRQRRLNS